MLPLCTGTSVGVLPNVAIVSHLTAVNSRTDYERNNLTSIICYRSQAKQSKVGLLNSLSLLVKNVIAFQFDEVAKSGNAPFVSTLKVFKNSR